MSSRTQPVKPTTVFEWEHEPVDERPSEFSSSSGYSTLSGFYPSPIEPPPRTRAPSRFGLATVIVAAIFLVGIGAWAMQWIARLPRG